MARAAGVRRGAPSARGAGPDAYERIRSIVARIPRGRVATYGQVALLAGLPRQARRVGYALHSLPDDRDLPWHRVVNASGGISPRAEPRYETIQRVLLEREGVVFGAGGRVGLQRFGWKPRARAP